MQTDLFITIKKSSLGIYVHSKVHQLMPGEYYENVGNTIHQLHSLHLIECLDHQQHHNMQQNPLSYNQEGLIQACHF